MRSGPYRTPSSTIKLKPSKLLKLRHLENARQQRSRRDISSGDVSEFPLVALDCAGKCRRCY